MRILLANVVVVFLSLLAVGIAAELPTLPELNDENFDDVVFEKGVDSEPYLIMFYAPWCPHCTKLKPTFAEAQQYALEDNNKAAKFALFDGTKPNKNVQEKHNVSLRSYPTMYYSLRGKLYKYEGARSLMSFVFYGRILAIAVNREKGIMDDFMSSDIRKGTIADTPRRVSYTFGLPEENGEKIANRIMDAVMTVGRTRFSGLRNSQLNEDNSDDVWKSTTKSLKKAAEHCESPEGAKIVASSDAIPEPRPYCGPWWTEDGQQVSPDLLAWFTNTAFPAVEAIDQDSWPMLNARGLVLVGAVTSAVESDARKALTAVAQHLSLRTAPTGRQIVIGILPCDIHAEFLESIGVDPKSCPTAFVLNSQNEQVYYLPGDLAAKLPQGQWSEKSVVASLNQYVDAVIEESIKPVKFHWYGKIAQVLLSLPPIGALKSYLGVGDLEFVMIAGMLVVSPILLLIAARGGPEDIPPQGQRRGGETKKTQ